MQFYKRPLVYFENIHFKTADDVSVSNVNHHIMTFNVNPPPFHTRSFFNMSRVRGQSKQEQSVCRGLCEKPPQSSRMFTAQIWVDALFPLSLIVSFSASDLWHFQHSSHLLVSRLPDFNLGFQKKKKETFCTVKTTKAKKKNQTNMGTEI